jgi:hypothetical protein
MAVVVIVVAVMRVFVVVLSMLVGGGVEPRTRITLRLGRIEAGVTQQQLRSRKPDRRCAKFLLQGLGGEGAQLAPPRPPPPSCERNLMHRLDVLLERVRTVHCVDGRDYGADAIEPGERQIG